MIGGYQMLDFKGVRLIENNGVKVDGITDFLREYYNDDSINKKPILLTNFTYGQIENNSVFITVDRAGTKFIAYFYNKQLEIVNDTVTLKPIA